MNRPARKYAGAVGARATRRGFTLVEVVVAVTIIGLGLSSLFTSQIGAIRDVMLAPERQSDVIAALSDPATRIVTITVTEKGYCHDPRTGRLQADHPDIQHDIGNLDAPRSVIGFIVAGLRRRREAGHPPFTVLSCDNLPANGRLFRGLITEFAAVIDGKLADWIASRENPLTARVMVNRLWQFVFGVGIVDTPSDFGANGTLPTHPDLLDWMAVEFMDNDWSIKHLLRQMLLSETFQQSSRPRTGALRIDADSRYLWRFSPRRLEAEAIWGPGGYDLVHDDGKRYYIPDSHGYVDPTIFDIDACRAKWGGAFEQGL